LGAQNPAAPSIDSEDEKPATDKPAAAKHDIGSSLLLPRPSQLGMKKPSAHNDSDSPSDIDFKKSTIKLAAVAKPVNIAPREQV
jgi:hypothetical protein